MFLVHYLLEKEAPMAKEKTPLVFTEEEQDIAAKIRERARTYNNKEHIKNLWEAAKYYSYNNYADVPQRVKQCISSLGGKRSAVARRVSAKIKVLPKK